MPGTEKWSKPLPPSSIHPKFCFPRCHRCRWVSGAQGVPAAHPRAGEGMSERLSGSEASDRGECGLKCPKLLPAPPPRTGRRCRNHPKWLRFPLAPSKPPRGVVVPNPARCLHCLRPADTLVTRQTRSGCCECVPVGSLDLFLNLDYSFYLGALPNCSILQCQYFKTILDIFHQLDC